MTLQKFRCMALRQKVCRACRQCGAIGLRGGLETHLFA